MLIAWSESRLPPALTRKARAGLKPGGLQFVGSCLGGLGAGLRHLEDPRVLEASLLYDFFGAGLHAGRAEAMHLVKPLPELRKALGELARRLAIQQNQDGDLAAVVFPQSVGKHAVGVLAVKKFLSEILLIDPTPLPWPRCEDIVGPGR